MRRKVFVSGPYSKGHVLDNVRDAIDAANRLWAAGFAPFVPHLNLVWHLVSPKPYEEWLDIDAEWLPACGLLVRLPGESSGADKEVALAESMGIPVYYGVEQLLAMESWLLAGGRGGG
jgi:hypothetical protein